MSDSNKTITIATETSIGILKGLVGAVPILGDAINEALFGINERIQQSRINDFVIHLRSQMLELELKCIDEEYLKSEDFYDLTRKIFESVIRIKSQEKQKALSKVYLNGIIAKADIEKDRTSIYSKFIIDLMPQQIQIMTFIEKYENELI